MDTIKDEINNQELIMATEISTTRFIVNGEIYVVEEVVRIKDENKLIINLKKE